jgi:glycosyltransferase involved in cell wall biosynthesis
MIKPAIDIIVPVWNRPVETRNCIVNLMDHSPDSRLIIVDNGSDRETERMLEEFAEILDQRAILLRNNINQGYVRAVNRGLGHAGAELTAVIRNTSAVTDSWLDPVFRFAAERGEAGIIVPRLLRSCDSKRGAGMKRSLLHIEVDHGSLAAMIITRKAYEAIGGLDEDMDGGVWCLRDLSRRALKAGFITSGVGESVVIFKDDIPLGSVERRNSTVKRSRDLFRVRWGESRAFSVHFPKGAGMDIFEKRLAAMLEGARQGHIFTVILHSGLFKDISKAGRELLHENIRYVRLPLLFEGKAIENTLKPVDPDYPVPEPVAGIDGIPFPSGIKAIPFSEIERTVGNAREEFYSD